MKTNAQTPRAQSPLFALLAHYVTGGIDEPIWQRFMGIMDADTIGSAERMAYARLLHDVLVDPKGSGSGRVGQDSMAGLRKGVRATRAA
ncbi:MAG: hypothetical protein O3C45_06355 [Bacteroidetes bacterium]|nr:hypothetical protein [Bacteroidota bacterium]